MWFWIWMFASSMVIPVLIIGFGKLFQKRPPVQINSIYGYRTKMSMINMDTWDYAHHYFGKKWLRAGCLIIPGTVLGMLLLFDRNENIVGIGSTVIMTVQVLALILPVIETEWELRRRFEPDGTRKQQDGDDSYSS